VASKISAIGEDENVLEDFVREMAEAARGVICFDEGWRASQMLLKGSLGEALAQHQKDVLAGDKRGRSPGPAAPPEQEVICEHRKNQECGKECSGAQDSSGNSSLSCKPAAHQETVKPSAGRASGWHSLMKATTL